MPLSRIKIQNFRNLSSIEISFDVDGFNIFVGENGSGKTSLLEAIHLLSCGRSFRTSDASQIIQGGKSSYVIYAKVFDGGREASMGVTRDDLGNVQVKLDGYCAKIADLHKLLPLRIISPVQTVELIGGGPKHRRDFLDWGVFHVKHSYLDSLRRFNRLLKQRNVALKMRCPDEELIEWNYQFSKVSKIINAERKEYIAKWDAHLRSVLKNMSVFDDLSIDYFSGWDERYDLEDVLAECRTKERATGYSLHGSHRADLLLATREGSAKERYSRGQQKILAIAMYLAQGRLLKEITGQWPVYLIDDFGSELDSSSQAILLNVLADQKAQVIITALNQAGLVEHGKVWSIGSGIVSELELEKRLSE